MSVIASALKFMLAAGMPHDDIVAAVEAMEHDLAVEAAARAESDPVVKKPRSAGAIRQARYAARKASLGVSPEVRNDDADVSLTEVTSQASESVTPDVITDALPAKGSISPIPKEIFPLHPLKEITLTPSVPQNVLDQNNQILDGKDPQPRTGARAGVSEATAPKIDDGWPPGFFEVWYAVYPKKKQPARARKALDSTRRSRRVTWSELMAATKRFALDPGDRQFVPHPASWLNAESWADEPEPQKTLLNRQRSGASRNDKPYDLAEALDRLQDEVDRRSDPEGEFQRFGENESFGFGVSGFDRGKFV